MAADTQLIKLLLELQEKQEAVNEVKAKILARAREIQLADAIQVGDFSIKKCESGSSTDWQGYVNGYPVDSDEEKAAKAELIRAMTKYPVTPPPSVSWSKIGPKLRKREDWPLDKFVTIKPPETDYVIE